jgi:hypothetical protein
MSDTHKVSTDALATLGTIIDVFQKRDAIHLAVEPVVAGCQLNPGQRIGFRADGKAIPVSHLTKHKTLGIVDPFLIGTVEEGQRFWLIVLPRQITSLRHVWEHPGFPATDSPEPPADSALAKSILEEFGSTADLTTYDDKNEPIYSVVMRALRGMDENGYVPFDATGDIPDKVWDAYEMVTGKRVSERHEYFSCAC